MICPKCGLKLLLEVDKQSVLVRGMCVDCHKKEEK